MFNTSNYNNEKGNLLRAWARTNDLDGIFCQESGLNWKKMPRSGRLEEMMRTEAVMRTIAAHNETEDIGRRQYGGTCAVAYGEFASRVTDTGKDPTGLGRWAWMRCCGRDDNAVRMVTAYNPCESGRASGRTVYNQHRRYWEQRGDSTDPNSAFLRDFEQALRAWRAGGDKLIVFIDMNENALTGKIDKMLRSAGLDMDETTRSRYPRKQPPPTWKRGDRVGSFPVDGCYATPDVTVLRSAWLAVHKCPGDHRMPVVEFSYQDLLGESVLKVVRPAARRLSSRIPAARQRYTSRLIAHFQRHRLLRKLYGVYKHSRSRLSKEQTTKMERIDKIRAEGMRYAEKRCRKLAMGMVDWSPQFDKARQQLILWRMVVRKKQGKKIQTGRIRRKARRCGIQSPLSCSLRQAQVSCKAALDAYNKIKPKAAQLRTEYLYERMHDHSQSVSESDRLTAKRLLREERQRDGARHLRRALGRTRSPAIDWIEVEEGEGDDRRFVRYSDKASVEQKIMENNEARFRLTETTPPMTEPLISDLGFLANTDAARQILEGSYERPDGMSTQTAEFIQSLRLAEPLTEDDMIPASVSKEDFQLYWKSVKERTSSSMSGLHFGHWKAAARSDELSEIHAVFTEIAVSTGYSPSRWQQGLSVMLEKTKDCRVPEKLRAILLMEADLNFANKLFFGKRMMYKAEDSNQIPREIQGSRKNLQAIDISINTGLTWDIFRQKKIAGTLTSVDAAACYDRMAHSIISLCAQGLGMPTTVLVCLLTTIQNMKFFLRTAHGDSDKFYGGPCAIPLQGCCQGNGGGPAMWIAVCMSLMKQFLKKGIIPCFRKAISGEEVTTAGGVYVDDATLAAAAQPQDESFEDLRLRTQHNVLQWQGDLQVTGGDCKLQKLYWTAADFVWDETGNWRYKTKDETAGDIFILGPNGEQLPIKQLEPSEAIVNVGVIQAADGNMDGQFEKFKEDIDDYGKAFHDSWVPRRLAWTGLRSMVWPSLSFPLAACTFSDEQADELTLALRKATVSKLGFSSSFPHAYLHAPTCLQGADVPDFKVEQGIALLERFLVHGCTNSQTDDLLECSLEQMQLEAGTGGPILEADFDAFGFLCTDCWLKALWRFLWTHDIHVYNPGYSPPPLQREGDSFIMDNLVSLQQYSNGDLIKINRCRLKKQVLTMADIIDGDGVSLLRDAHTLVPSLSPGSKYDWPIEKPARTDWNLWAASIRRLTPLAYFDRLGRWTTDPHTPSQWLYSPSTNTLFKSLPRSNPPSHYRYTARARTRRTTYEVQDCSRHPLPSDVCPASAHVALWGRAVLTGWARKHTRPTPTHETIHSLIESWDACTPLRISDFDQAEAVANAIADGQACAVADGSYMPNLTTNLATAAWCIEDKRATGTSCSGVTAVSGTEKERNAYRAELQGIHTLLMAVKAVCTFFHITNGSMELYCDCESALRLSGYKNLQFSLSTKHADLIRAIRIITSKLPISVTFLDIAGHQDDDLLYEQLDRPAQLNVDMDRKAKSYLRRLFRQSHAPAVPTDVHDEGWRCIVRDTKITSSPAEPIRFHIAAKILQTHLHDRDVLPASLFFAVDWTANGGAFRDFPQLFRLWATKHVSGICGVGRQMKLRGEWEDDKCPCCDEVERTKHVVVCPDPRRHDVWMDALESLEAWFGETKTDPAISRCILETLIPRTPTHFNNSHVDPSDLFLRAAAEDQDEIGWMNFVEGRISCKWREAQADYYLSISCNRSARRWAEGLVQQLLSCVHKLWIARNAVVHERDADGRYIKEKIETENAIDAEFDKEYENLRPQDFHLIDCGREKVLQQSSIEQHEWLHYITVARDIGSQEEDTTITQLRNDMSSWLRQGR